MYLGQLLQVGYVSVPLDYGVEYRLRRKEMRGRK